MDCNNINECFEQINAYFQAERLGLPLIVNAENDNDYREIIQLLEADHTKKKIYISNYCFPNGLPDVDSALAQFSDDNNVLIGLAQAQMFRSAKDLAIKLDEVLSLSISGYALIVLYRCEQVLRDIMRKSKDERLPDRIAFVLGDKSVLPQIRLINNKVEAAGYSVFSSFSDMLSALEHMQPITDTFVLQTSFSSSIFKNSVYPISMAPDIYTILIAKYSDIASAVDKSCATAEQWCWLAEKMLPYKSFSELVCEKFGSTINLSMHLADIYDKEDKNLQWLHWLAMKVFAKNNSKYLALALHNSCNLEDFKIHLYLDLSDVDIDDVDFEKLYLERKRLLTSMPENISLVKKYCDRLGRYQKNAVFYLTDNTDIEKHEFLQYLNIYDYTESELNLAVQRISKPLALYMKQFIFDNINTHLSDKDDYLRPELTRYFHNYKVQKLTNRLQLGFVAQVKKYALARPYNKLQSRSSIISHMDRKGAQLFFFDALGVEYLSFILAKCKEYDLVYELSIGRCELPSITSKNKEFLQYFAENACNKIDALDELKHYSEVFDYEKCKLPLHLFTELDIIDEELRKIQSQLVQGTIEKAIIVADHGASRLAVLYGKENEALPKISDGTEHSGRCCLAEKDPCIEYAAYDDGYVILANYERFKGGRRANVEVHGGASLEEVLVPVITLTRQPENIEICFVDSTIILHPREIPVLVLYSSIPLQKPRLKINDEFIEGEFVADAKHAKFELPKVKRKGIYFAEVYDGEQNMSVNLSFTAQKHTREIDLL